MVVFAFLLIGVSAIVKVIEPYQLKNDLPNDGSLVSTLANFGNPPYGSYILGRVYKYSTEPTFGCSVLDPVKFQDEPGTYSHPILLLDRGGCSFVVKARQAQTIGAQALIIINNIETEDITKILMVDDGTAGNIFIPTIMITKKDGDTIKDYMDSHSKASVKMQLTFPVPNPDDQVEYEFWMSPENPELLKFLVEFSKHAKKLAEITVFSPHFKTWPSVERQQEGFKTRHKDCLGAGRYCAYDPDNSGSKNGADIVVEGLRQICIFAQIHVNEEKYKTLWWDYVQRYGRECEILDEACSKTVLKELGFKYEVIQECIDKSVIKKGDKDGDLEMDQNWVLDNERKIMKERGISFVPVIIINNVQYRGDLEADEVLKMVCAGFSNEPEYCAEYFADSSQMTITKRIGSGTVLLIMFFALVAFVVILFLYRKWLREDINRRMKAEVNLAVNQYIALTDQSFSRSS